MNHIIKKINSLRKLFVLGYGVRSKVCLPLLSVWIPLRNRLGIHSKFEYVVRLSLFGTPFTFHISDYFDQLVLEEIIYDKEYDMVGVDDPRVIIDLGSNVGSSVIYFKLRYPRAKIYGIEADPQLFEKLKKNVAQFPDIEVYNMAVAPQDGTMKFYLSGDAPLSSSLIERGEDQRSIEVQAISLDSFMQSKGVTHIDLIKFDIEGSELEVFKNFENLKNVDHLIGELHLDLIKGTEQDFRRVFSDQFVIDMGRSTHDRYVFKASAREVTR